ncbi:hypothetical protein [Aquimarina agarivorans]|nr:hypothetical protein [Aquimarina agarivorans]
MKTVPSKTKQVFATTLFKTFASNRWFNLEKQCADILKKNSIQPVKK